MPYAIKAINILAVHLPALHLRVLDSPKSKYQIPKIKELKLNKDELLQENEYGCASRFSFIPSTHRPQLTISSYPSHVTPCVCFYFFTFPFPILQHSIFIFLYLLKRTQLAESQVSSQTLIFSSFFISSSLSLAVDFMAEILYEV